MADLAESHAATLKPATIPTPRGHWFAGLSFLVLIGTITLAPVLYVVVESFDVAPLGMPFRFGLDGWADLLASPRTASAITYSFVLSLRVPIAIAVALAIAWLLIRIEVPGRRFIELTLLFGFFLPSVPMTMGWILLLDSSYGLINILAQKLPFVSAPPFSIYSVPGIMWVHLSLTTVPIMVILLTPALRQLDLSYEEAAEMAGAPAWSVWSRVILPLIAPAIITALIAGLIRSLETFEVEQLIGVPANIFVYATRIFELVNREPPLFPQALALSTVFLAILFGLAGLFQLYLRRRGARATLTGKGLRQSARPRAWARLASLVLFAYVGFSILLPLAVLIAGSFNKLFGFFFIAEPWTASHWTEVLSDESFLSAAVNSVGLGGAVGVIGVVLFALAAWTIVRSRLWSRGIASFLIWLPWAIPGLVLGLTLLSLLLNVPGLNRLYGTLLPLVLALIVKELPIGVQLIRVAIAQTSPELEEAGRMAGANFLHTFRRITLPVIAPTLVSVFLLVFASTVRDISTVVLVAAPGTRTLSLLMFDYASSGRFEQAAVIGVIIALIALAVSALAFRLGSRQSIRL